MGKNDVTAKQIEDAVDAAIERGDFDEASRLSAGHPNAATHLRMMERIHAARSGEAPKVDAPEDLAGETPRPAHRRAFQVAGVVAKLKHLNLRAEKHGAEEVPAIDVKLEANLPQSILDLFDPALRGLFYKSTDPQDLADQAHPAPNLRIPEIKPLQWKRNIEGASVVIGYGIADDSAVDFGLARVRDFVIDPREGGTCVLTFKITAQNVRADDVGKLSALLKREIVLTVTPPETGWRVEEVDGDEDED